MDLSKIQKLFFQKSLHSKGQLNLTTEVLNGFIPGVFNRLCGAHIKSSNNGNLELKYELIVSPFLKIALKATVVNSDS